MIKNVSIVLFVTFDYWPNFDAIKLNWWYIHTKTQNSPKSSLTERIIYSSNTLIDVKKKSLLSLFPTRY